MICYLLVFLHLAVLFKIHLIDIVSNAAVDITATVIVLKAQWKPGALLSIYLV